jgi:hypothetical protein
MRNIHGIGGSTDQGRLPKPVPACRDGGSGRRHADRQGSPQAPQHLHSGDVAAMLESSFEWFERGAIFVDINPGNDSLIAEFILLRL